jgi:hypothetical protein
MAENSCHPYTTTTTTTMMMMMMMMMMIIIKVQNDRRQKPPFRVRGVPDPVLSQIPAILTDFSWFSSVTPGKYVTLPPHMP